MTEIEPLAGTTTGGLPWPASTDPLTQGANDIKALALALDARGGGYGSLRGSGVYTFDSGGRATIPLPAGLATFGGGFVMHLWDAAAPFAPMVCNLETSKCSTTKLGVWAAQAGTSTLTWWTTPARLCWLAWGTAA
jgi:hypothetical protein